MSKGTSGMEVSPFKRVLGRIFFCGVLLSSLLLAAACSKGTFSKSKASSQLTAAEQEEQDPEFWRMWEERRGLGE
jgi:hypothetical protein